ncbi:hypothetical protein FKZ61_023005, partial [Litorilinea aerophila]
MKTTTGSTRRHWLWTGMIGFVALLAAWIPAGAWAQEATGSLTELRSLYLSDVGVEAGGGVAYDEEERVFYVLEVGDEDGSRVRVFTPYEEYLGQIDLDIAVDPGLNLAYGLGRLWILTDGWQELVGIRPDGLEIEEAQSIHIGHLGLSRVAGLAVDEAAGVVWLLDAAQRELVGIQVAGEASGGLVGRVSLAGLGEDLAGLARDPRDGSWYVLEAKTQVVYQLTPDGTEVNRYSMSALELRAVTGLVWAPSPDLTDGPDEWHLFLLDSGVARPPARPVELLPFPLQLFLPMVAGDTGNNVAAGEAAVSQPPRLVEVIPARDGEKQVYASLVTLSLVRAVDMAALSPPSPDPAGLTYVSASNTLLVSDSEVEETVSGITHFQGANLWELTLGGNVVRTANISREPPTDAPMTDEPTGVAWDPLTGDYFFTDDGTKRVYRLHPGADGLIGTADDTWDSFDLRPANNLDPEGITVDTWNHRLFVVDGVNLEVYQYTITGTLISQFDVDRYGLLDPESVEFNPDTGTLFIMDSIRRNQIIIETTLNGDLIETYDMSAADSRKAAGLAYAPASDGSGQKHLYIVARGRDNNSNPSLIDGMMYEMAGLSQPVNSAPVAVDDSVSTMAGTAVVIDVAANDSDVDGNLDVGTVNT